MYSKIGKSVLNDHLGSNIDPCYIQNRVIMNRVIKRLKVYNFQVQKSDIFLIFAQNIDCGYPLAPPQ